MRYNGVINAVYRTVRWGQGVRGTHTSAGPPSSCTRLLVHPPPRAPCPPSTSQASVLLWTFGAQVNDIKLRVFNRAKEAAQSLKEKQERWAKRCDDLRDRPEPVHKAVHWLLQFHGKPVATGQGKDLARRAQKLDAVLQFSEPLVLAEVRRRGRLQCTACVCG
jgi:hypothetical protein